MSEIPDRILKFLDQANVAITNTMKSSEVMDALAEYEYDMERIEEGRNLYNNAYELTVARQNTWTRYQTDGSRLRKYWKKLKNIYNDDIAIARIAFRNQEGVLDTLQARGTRKPGIAEWIKEAMVFYANALKSDEIIAGLNRFGLNRKKLKEHQKQMETLEPKVADKEALKGKARSLTGERNKALKKLAHWLEDLKTVIFILYKGTKIPVSMGWKDKSEGYKPVGRPKKKKQAEQVVEQEPSA